MEQRFENRFSEKIASSLNDPKIALNNTRSKVPSWYICTSTPCPNFKSVSLYNEPFPRYCKFSFSHKFQSVVQLQNSKKELLCRLSRGTDIKVWLKKNHICTLKEWHFKSYFRKNQVHRSTPKWPRTLRRETHLILYILYYHLSEFQISLRFALWLAVSTKFAFFFHFFCYVGHNVTIQFF